MAENPKELEQVSAQDVDAVTERLKEWIPTLPEQEQSARLAGRVGAGDEQPAPTEEGIGIEDGEPGAGPDEGRAGSGR